MTDGTVSSDSSMLDDSDSNALDEMVAGHSDVRGRLPGLRRPVTPLR